jgi:hypothetical protein
MSTEITRPKYERAGQRYASDQLTWGLNGYFVAADLHRRDVTLEADPVGCDPSADQDRALIVAEHLERIHPPT